MPDRRHFLRTATTAMAALGAARAARWSDAPTVQLRPPGASRLAVRPVPSPAQLRWQREELALFLHFGINTFLDREWGDGTESPRLFNPGALDARAWARDAKSAGFRSLVLTAKHHDGFCLWPSATTTHSVRSSPWRGGQGDLMRELADACRLEGLGLGVYLSPWDRHEPRYGDSPAYMRVYLAQLEELLTRYGAINEVWFDGANGEGPNGRKQQYDWPSIHSLVRRLQPGAVIFSDAGPDVRWIGNESGVAGETCWSTIDPAAVPYAGYDAPGVGDLLQRGSPDGRVWRPGESDVSIRPGWFWHPAEDAKVRAGSDLMLLYKQSVGRNSKLLLNVPPNRDGVLSAPDRASLVEFGRRRRDLLGTDLASLARCSESSMLDKPFGADRVVDGNPDSYWEAATGAPEGSVELLLRRPTRCTVIRLQEPIARGQVIESFTITAPDGAEARVLAEGTTVGYCRLVEIPPTTIERLRVTVRSTLGPLRLSTLSVHAENIA